MTGCLVASVGVRRLELPASTSRTWRANQLCYTPDFLAMQRYTFFLKQNLKSPIFLHYFLQSVAIVLFLHSFTLDYHLKFVTCT